jgi:hypothetical protein
VLDRPVALPGACPLDEAEHPDQPVHRRACVLVQEIGDDLWVRVVVCHDKSRYRLASLDHATRCLEERRRTAGTPLKRWIRRSGQIVQIQNHRLHGKAVADIEALSAVVGRVGGDRSSLRTLLCGPTEKCRHELLADTAIPMAGIDMNAFQISHPYGMHTARAAQTGD